MAGNSFRRPVSLHYLGRKPRAGDRRRRRRRPTRLPLAEPDIQQWLDKRKPGQSRFTTQRREEDLVRIMRPALLDGVTTGTPIQLLIENTDQLFQGLSQHRRPISLPVTPITPIGRNTAYATIAGGGPRLGARDCPRVAAGAVARKILRFRVCQSAVHWFR